MYQQPTYRGYVSTIALLVGVRKPNHFRIFSSRQGYIKCMAPLYALSSLNCETLKDFVRPSVFKEYVPNLVNDHNRTPIIEFYVLCVVLRTDTQKICVQKRLDYLLKSC